MNFSYLAQDFVEATSQLVSGRTINLMDSSGNIIASTQKERIGTFHQGAAEVIRTGKPVLIEKEELSQYPGSREGYNMPIFDEGRLIGVIGIFGNPSEVEELGNLLRVYVTQFIRQDVLSRRAMFLKEVNAQIIRLLLYGKEEDMGEIRHLCNTGDICFLFPVKVYYFRRKVRKNPERGKSEQMPDSFEDLEQQLLWKNHMLKGRDVYGAYARGFLWFHSLKKSAKDDFPDMEVFIKENPEYFVIGSRICTEFSQVGSAFREINAFLEESGEIYDLKKRFYDMEKPHCQQKFYFHVLSGKCGKPYLEKMYEKLLQQTDKKMSAVLLTTALVYYEEDGSTGRAAQRLHLHKNTLLYRLNRLYACLGLEEENSFTREFFIRLLISRYPEFYTDPEETGE